MSNYNQSDALIERDRMLRAVVAVVSPLVIVLSGWIGGLAFAWFFKLPALLGSTVGFTLGGLAAVWVITRSFILNAAVVGAFVTVDPLKSLFGAEKAHVSYGPGLHLCYWWEQREGGNNVDLSEMKEDFNVQVQGPTGAFHVKYSVRLRPDIKRLPEFLGGVAAIAGDLGGIISAAIAGILSQKKVLEGVTMIPDLNEKLKLLFERGQEETPFEKRFGVIIGDITVDEIRPSAEAQKAIEGATESAALERIVLQSLGYSSMRQVRQAIKDGRLTHAQLNLANENAMVITNNLHGLNLGRQVYTVLLHGDQGVVDAVQGVAPHAAGIIQALKGGGQGKGKQNPSSKKGPSNQGGKK